MNDLSGLSWDTAPSTANGPNRTNTQSPFLRSGSAIPRQATPLSAQQSGRNTPVSVPNSAIRPTPSGHDSFSNLLPSNASKKTTSLSLQERQKQLLEEKARQAAAQHGDAQFWDTLNRTSSPAPATSGVGAPGLPIQLIPFACKTNTRYTARLEQRHTFQWRR